ncbi:MAG TPA: NUDIX hydrolase [Candidatus Saccharimonadales bacterium]|nr:NUDIX hydrolase [Candidatus Saccharimonadales bacterium]
MQLTMKPWKLVKSQIVFDNYTKIEERTYELPGGQTKNFYIKLSGRAACVVAFTEDGKIITVEQFRPGPDRVLCELPGGGVDGDETYEQAIARELREETGYEGELQFVAECVDDAYATMLRGCFVATNCKKVGDQQLDDSEFMNVKLLELPEFLEIIRAGQMTDVEAAFLGLDFLGVLRPQES